MRLKQTLLMIFNHLELEQLFEDATKFSDRDECKFFNKLYGSMTYLQTLGVTTNE
ncbi:hypothetical protein ACQKMI_19210 [Lysinibacillus sp. NPDC097214]|uniref:hypothetical protein n=1 Tax=Lysinibacillus sp. NPDC097214 TaxID=3390584 RepID=UPI003CFC7CD0